MKKENIRYTAILLCFAAMVTVFAACTKNNENSGATSTTATTVYVPSEFKTEKEKLFTQDGKLYYRVDSEGDAHELVTDENGVTVVDDNGNMIWKVTDAEGNEATQPVSFPNFMNEGNKISCQQFTITCPSGWESSSDINFRLKNVAENKLIEYSYRDKSDKSYKDIDEEIAGLEESLKAVLGDNSAVFTKTETQIAGRAAVKLAIEMGGETPSYMETYCVEDKNGIMVFNCFCNYTDKGFDFKAILDTIEYRVK